MPKDHNALFQQNPLAFMRKYSCKPIDRISNYNGLADPKKLGFGETTTDYTLRRIHESGRIAYLDFEKISHTSTSPTTGQVVVKGSYLPHSGGVPSFFLPWLDESIIRIDIPAGRLLNGPDPRFFFTAGINGCSIFIKGNRQSPVVFHAGGQTGKDDPEEGARFWRTLMESHEGTSSLHWAAGPTLAEVNKTHYTVDEVSIGSRTMDTGYIVKTVDKLGTRNSRSFETWLKEDTDGEFIIEDVAPEGCVMGIRDDKRDWTFYLQENVAITYYSFKKKGFLIKKKKKIESSRKTVMRPLQVTEIFPGGNGHHKFAPAMSRALKK
ncbi:MAG TPA: hypothetical protein VGN16_15470 [Acidobacteriaceae bacterium]|jgi:hypothetical protein